MTCVSLALITAYAMTVAYLACRGGPRVSEDSTHYLAAAQNVLDGRGFRDVTCEQMTIFPVGYSAILALASFATGSLPSAAARVNVVVAGAVVPLSFLLARRVIGGQILPLLVSALVAASLQWLVVLSMVWSEPAFTVVVLIACLVLVREVSDESMRIGALALFSVLVWLATFIRYAGVFLAVAGALVIAFYLHGPVRRRLRWAAGSLCASLLGPLVLIVVNQLTGGSAVGQRKDAFQTVESAVAGTMTVFGEMLAPSGSTVLTQVVGVLVAALIVAATWGAFLTRNRRVVTLAIVVLTYWTVIWASQARTHVNVPGARFLVPVLAPSIFLVIFGLVGLRQLMLSQLNAWLAGSRWAEDPRPATAAAATSRIVLAAMGVLTVLLGVYHAWQLVRSGTVPEL